MLVSIIIPTFNSAKFLSQTIESALNQTYKNTEIIIVDDNSTDKTVEIIKDYQNKNSKIKFYKIKNYKKTGSGSGSKPRNFGIKKSKGKYIAFLDSDDLWEKNKLQRQVETITPNTDISFTKCHYLHNQSKSKEKFIKEKFIDFSLNKLPGGLLLYNPIRLSSVIIKREVFRNVNFNEEKEIRGIEDLELWLNIFLKKKLNKQYIKEYLVTIRRHKNNLSKNYTSNVIKNIYSISRYMIREEKYKNLRFFISGIFFRVIQLFYKRYSYRLKKYLLNGLIFTSFIWLLIFKSPLFWYLGNKLVYSSNLKNVKIGVIFSGHGSLNYENKTYQNRYLDAKNLLEKKFVEKVYILGREQIIPESKIISALLLYDGIEKEMVIPLNTYKRNTKDNINFAGKFVKDIGLKEIIFVTDPYHSLRSKLIWKKYHPDVNVIFNPAIDRPNKTKVKWSSDIDHVKVVIYEYLAIIYNYFKRWI